MELWFEGCGLLLQAIHQFAASANWQARNVVNRFVGVERHALAAHHGEGIHHLGVDVLQAELEHLKQTHRPSAYDQGVGADGRGVGSHGQLGQAQQALALQFRQLAGFVFPVIGVWQGRFALGDAGPADARQLGVHGGHVLLIRGHILFGVDGVDRALGDANRAIDALIRVDGQEIRAFAKAIDGTNVHTVGVFTADTGFGDNVGHGGIFKRGKSTKGWILGAGPKRLKNQA